MKISKNKTNLITLKEVFISREVFVLLLFFLLFWIFDQPLFESIFLIGKNIFILFSKHNYSSKEWQIVILTISFIVFLFFNYYKLKKIIKKDSQVISPTFCFSLILFGIYYSVKRFSNNNFQFEGIEYELAGFSFANKIKYIDAIFISMMIYSILIFKMIFSSILKTPKILTKNSFWETDKPLSNPNNDNLLRAKLAKKIAQQINTFTEDESSFSIGIIGPWGSGKSTFLNFIKSKVSINRKNLVIDFNPWQYPDDTNISRKFLKELQIILDKHSNKASQKINQYIHSLFDEKRNFWSSVINIFIKMQNLAELHLSIKNSIKDSKKRIIVFIDDIDRLEYHEVYEILTIIRNIGDLPNTIFVLAYDKDYLLTILEKTIDNPQQYLYKFFQVEYALGNIDIKLLNDELADGIKDSFPKIFANKDLSSITSVNISAFENIYTFVQTLEGIRLIKNRRDIKKLLNSIRLTWPQLHNHLLFRDYLKLEILRLKYGNIFAKIKYADRNFLAINNGSYKFINNLDKKSSDNLQNIIADNNDRDEIFRLLESLFPSNKFKLKEGEIRNPNYFNMYFKNDIFDDELVTTVTTTLENG